MGYSFVRFLPKESGVRCITNLRRRANKLVYRLLAILILGISCISRITISKILGSSINSILKPIFSILNLERV